MNNRMNNLPQTQQTNMPVLGQYVPQDAPKHLVPYLEAKNTPIVLQMKPNAAKNKLKDMLLVLYSINGQTLPEDKPLIVMRDMLYTQIVKKHTAVTISEVETALQCGVMGDYEERTGKLFGGITVANCMIWIKCYLTSEQRAEAFKPLPTKPVVLTPEQEAEILKIRKAGFEMLKTKFVEPIKQAEKQERRARSLQFSRERSQDNNIEHKWLLQFDKIQFTRGWQMDNGTRCIFMYGRVLTVSDYLKCKAEQYIRVTNSTTK